MLKERATHLARYTFFTRDFDHYKKRHFQSFISHQEHLFHRTPITGYFSPVNVTKFLRTAFL